MNSIGSVKIDVEGLDVGQRTRRKSGPAPVEVTDQGPTPTPSWAKKAAAYKETIEREHVTRFGKKRDRKRSSTS